MDPALKAAGWGVVEGSRDANQGLGAVSRKLLNLRRDGITENDKYAAIEKIASPTPPWDL